MAFDTDYDGLKAALPGYLKRGDLTTQIPDFIFLAERRVLRKLTFPSGNDTFTAGAALVADQAYLYAPIATLELLHLEISTDPLRELEVMGLRGFMQSKSNNISGIPRALYPSHDFRQNVAISSYATYDGGAKTQVNCAADHRLGVGATVTIAGSGVADYNSTWDVSEIVDSDSFIIDVAFNGDGGASVFKIDQMKILFDEAPASAYDCVLYYRPKFTHLRDGAGSDTSWLLATYPEVLLYGSLMEAEPYIKNDPRAALWAALLTEAMGDMKKQQWRRRAGGGELRVRADVPLP